MLSASIGSAVAAAAACPRGSWKAGRLLLTAVLQLVFLVAAGLCCLLT